MTDSQDLQPAAPHTAKKNNGIFWMLVPVLLLLSSVVGWVVMVSIALDDPGFSVESDYYKKASHYDDQIEQRAKNVQLGWSISLEEAKVSLSNNTGQLRIHVKNAEGAPLPGLVLSASAFAVARGRDVRVFNFSEESTGTYVVEFPRARGGLWEVRLRAEGGNSTYTQTMRAEFFPAEDSAS